MAVQDIGDQLAILTHPGNPFGCLLLLTIDIPTKLALPQRLWPNSGFI
jgi:hypothetical protein